MTNLGPIRFVVGFLSLVVLCAFVAPRRASAGNVTITLNPGPLTVTEGNTLTFNWTITNNTGSTIFSPAATFAAGFNLPLVSGDILDAIGESNGVSGCLTMGSLAPGSSCSVSADTFSLLGDTEDSDFAVQQLYVDFPYLCPNCIGDTDPYSVLFGQTSGYVTTSSRATLTVLDPGVTLPTPEPSSLLLLGTGLLGLLAAKGLEPLIRLLARTS